MCYYGKCDRPDLPAVSTGPKELPNGDTLKQLLFRSRYLLYKSPGKWTESQKVRARLLFDIYPDMAQAYSLSHKLRLVYSKTKDKGVAYTKQARWFCPQFL